MKTVAPVSEIYQAVADALRACQRPLFITGAGMSADSGLPTYRGLGGLYNHNDTDEGYAIEDALSGRMLREKPEVCWKYLWQIASSCRGKKCNRGHKVLASIEDVKPETWVLTQNIDGFHSLAGSQNIIEIHGKASQLICLECGARASAEEWIDGYSGEPKDLPPKCPKCNGVVRPEVVLFGESLPDEAIEKLNYLVYHDQRDLIFSIGTTGVFPYIAQPILMAQAAGIPTVEINPCETELSSIVEYRIAEKAANALEKIWNLCNY
ncbi:MAG: NAD-dependent protein deacylase [Verrucomicrobiota bacterium]